ncbi:MipA/OmpV family protein [Telmatospirillum sp.]|uniref:MipA/OmpV family protein n=1 Tax=Telmatospirillum sp. TaxID=2079197 RepID=UPI00284B70CF|nr:MipA/OmpV family protein [Telmatospirillum sp.]MDR3435829.1 MipA/OmpV family protein [Telmatospirillum sp.]
MSNKTLVFVSVFAMTSSAFCASSAADETTKSENSGRQGSFSDRFTDTANWDVTLATGGVFSPRYEGSNRTTVSGGGLANASYDKGTFFFGMSGIGVKPIKGDNYGVTVALGYNGGRDEKDDRRNLRGLGDVDCSLLGNVSGEYTLGPVTFGLDVARALSGKYGTTADLSVGSGVPVTETVTLNGAVHTKLADADHMRNFFGVSTRQSAASGKRAFTPDAGVKSVGLSVNAVYQVTKSWAFSSTVATDWLVGDAGRSPVTVKRAQISGNLGVVYSF